MLGRKSPRGFMEFFRMSVGIISLVFLSVGCGKKPVEVKNLELQTEVLNQELFVDLKAEIVLGNLPLTTLDLPIIHPRSMEWLGNVKIQRENKKNFILLSLNLTALARFDLKPLILPNGGALPIGANLNGVQINLGRGIEFYFIPDLKNLLIGVTFPIKQLDQVGRSIGETSLFPPFNIKNVMGAIGLYSSRSAGKNGLGFFADLSSVATKMDPVMIDPGAIVKEVNVKKPISLNTPNSRQYQFLSQEMIRLSERKGSLVIP